MEVVKLVMIWKMKWLLVKRNVSDSKCLGVEIAIDNHLHKLEPYPYLYVCLGRPVSPNHALQQREAVTHHRGISFLE